MRYAFDTMVVQLGAAKGATSIVGEDPLPGHASYLLGQNRWQWVAGVETYARVRYHDLYPGIDLTYYGRDGQVQGDYLVCPGADPSLISQRIAGDINGVTGIQQDAEGGLLFSVDGGTLTEARPRIYQDVHGRRRTVAGQYVLQPPAVGTAVWTVRFHIGAYDHHLPLVIDPELTYSTYLGGSGANQGRGVTVDAQGNVYVVGGASINFPGSPLPGEGAPAQNAEVPFITKLDSSGNVIYSTLFGDPNDPDGYATAVAVDSTGKVYLTGHTSSQSFPTTANAVLPTPPGVGLAFVVVLDASGASMLYSTYLGQKRIDDTWGQAIAVDPVNGNTYVVGETQGAAYPYTSNFPVLPGGNRDPAAPAGSGGAFFSKISTTRQGYYCAGTLGAGADSWAYGLALDSAHDVYITGYAPAGAFSPTYTPQSVSGGGAFVAELDTYCGYWHYAALLGGNANSGGQAIAVDASGDAFITGYTAASDFPATFGVYHAPSRGRTDAFVTELNPNGNGLLSSTVIDGDDTSQGNAIALDANGNTYITGATSSWNFPLVGSVQPQYGGGNTDAFVAEFSPYGRNLLFSTLLGGSGDDVGNAIAVDQQGDAIVAGTTSSLDFPTLNALQPSNNGTSDAFVSTFSPPGLPSIAFPTGTNGCSGPLVRIYGDASLQGYFTQAARDYCNDFAAIGSDLGSVPDVEYVVNTADSSQPGCAVSLFVSTPLGFYDAIGVTTTAYNAPACQGQSSFFSGYGYPVRSSNIVNDPMSTAATHVYLSASSSADDSLADAFLGFVIGNEPPLP